MLNGIDISKWQPTTPSLAGLAFAFARATYATTVDPKYATHVANFRRAGIVVGAYHFGVGHKTVAAQVKAFLAASKGADLLVLDLERDSTKTMTQAEARAFIKAVQAAGKKIGLYHSRSGFPSLGQDYNWVAQWRTAPPFGIPWAFWQWQGSPLDRDKFNGDKAALLKLAGKTPVVPPKEGPVATDPNIRLAKAIEDQGRYLGNKFEKGDTSDAIGRLAKVSGFVSRILTSLSPVAVAAPSDSDETVSSGFFPSWADARAGKIDLSGPAQDAYGGFMQWAATRLGWATPPAGSLFARGDQNDAWQLATNFLGHGERLYPSDVYPVIPSDVLKAVFGSADPAVIRAAIEPYRAKLRAGGVPIEDRPETAA
jgi:hypothetical protein